MSISFNNIPTTIRTPGTYTEVDNSRALKGLVQNPHKVLILGQKEAAGTATKETDYLISNEVIADGYFGLASPLARMCRAFKLNNPNTELHAIALSDTTTVGASGRVTFAGSVTAPGTLYMMLGGSAVTVATNSGWSAADVASAFASAVQADKELCMTASKGTASVDLKAIGSGLIGNYYDIRKNYYDGQSDPPGLSVTIGAMAGGVGTQVIGGAWAAIDTLQYQHIIQGWCDASSLNDMDDELETRFGPMVQMQGFGYAAVRGTLASCMTLGLTRNSPHQMLIGANNSPTNPEIWAAALGGVCSQYLNQDPARPLHYLELKGVLPPPAASRFTRAERDQLLYDGISTFVVSSDGKVLIERPITTYRTNALGGADPSYLDVNTMFTLMEIRYQYTTRMTNRFLVPRFKLADDTFPIQPGQYVVTPKTARQEIIALFYQLQDAGLIENAADFATNLVVERDSTDVNRLNVLLPPNLINQFRILASSIQFIL